MIRAAGFSIAFAFLATGCYVDGGGSSMGSSRVWSTSNSNDGYAQCPHDTTVTGGGFEIKEQDRSAGRVPLVVASRPEGNGWRVVCVDPSGGTSASCRSWAACASVLGR